MIKIRAKKYNKKHRHTQWKDEIHLCEFQNPSKDVHKFSYKNKYYKKNTAPRKGTA